MYWLKPVDPHVTSNIMAAVHVLLGRYSLTSICLRSYQNLGTEDIAYQFLTLKPFPQLD